MRWEEIKKPELHFPFICLAISEQVVFSMAYNQQQQPQQQQFVLTGQMVNIDGQQVLQQPQYVTINQPAMATANVGKSPI